MTLHYDKQAAHIATICVCAAIIALAPASGAWVLVGGVLIISSVCAVFAMSLRSHHDAEPWNLTLSSDAAIAGCAMLVPCFAQSHGWLVLLIMLIPATDALMYLRKRQRAAELPAAQRHTLLALEAVLIGIAIALALAFGVEDWNALRLACASVAVLLFAIAIYTMGGWTPLRAPQKERKLSRSLISIPIATCVYGLAYSEGATSKAVCLAIAVAFAAAIEIDRHRTKPQQSKPGKCATP